MLLLFANKTDAQKIFNQVSETREVTSIAQDPQGYIWYGSTQEGLLRYDGSKVISITNDKQNPNSLASNDVQSIVIDSLGNIWIGTFGSGLDRYDPLNNTFTHYQHNSKAKGSLSNDTIRVLLLDRSGNLWVGTYGGLDLLDGKTGTFTHYANKPDDPTSLSHNHIWAVYEDLQGTLWIGCGSRYAHYQEKPEEGGLNRFDKRTGKFTRYLHDPGNPNSIANNKVRAILEDSKGNFWVGTAGDGLHTMDRATGKFTHYYYDSAHPEKLSRPPLYQSLGIKDLADFITFIHEDANGFIWIGSFYQGINQYNPETKKVIHHGYIYQQGKPKVFDTLSGFSSPYTWTAFSSKDGLVWLSAKGLSKLNTSPKPVIPYVSTGTRTKGFYEDENGSLWIGTRGGLIEQDVIKGKEKKFIQDPDNINSIAGDFITAIKRDSDGKLWLGTDSGLNKFDPVTQTFTHYRYNTKKGSISGDAINTILFDHNKDLWIGTWDSGLNKLDIKTGFFTPYKHDRSDSASLSDNRVLSIVEDRGIDLWVGTNKGLNRLNKRSGKFKHYLLSTSVNSVFVDNRSVIWAGGKDELYRYDQIKDEFLRYSGNGGWPKIDKVINIIEDNQSNLWISATNFIFRISADRSTFRVFGSDYEVHKNSYTYTNNYKTKSGQLLLADQGGYYTFSPELFSRSSYPPQINITSFQLGDEELKPGKGSPLTDPLYMAKEISLHHNQNSFSIGFWAIHYTSFGEEQYQYMLQNYDNVWHDAGDEHKAYFFNIPHGHYLFHVRATNSDGVWSEKTLAVVVSPPWWQTWWAIGLFALSSIAIVWAFASYRSRRLRKENRILEEKVSHRTVQLQRSLDELKSTQTQLIQSEKMASLGELTAGIAHEIQNPLNFVNNFSDVNTELIEELQTELRAGNTDEAFEISNDLKDNLQKITHHGKRADAIVKGMLQHSRATSGNKEPTDINALADEYLRLSYHGLRAKDKDFNADFTTDFDESIGKIEVVPQDIGRVLLNLYNNAFYAVNEKKRQLNGTFKPAVSVSTKRTGDRVEIVVRDNGNGIPQKVVDKIFQPFFTTKPTGQGTGLGLSLSYDIIKAHGGELKVETKEGEEAEFIILIPSNSSEQQNVC
jgi:signal transduction histidine kinase/ligand-binding sensor domain-containing protein